MQKNGCRRGSGRQNLCGGLLLYKLLDSGCAMHGAIRSLYFLEALPAKAVLRAGGTRLARTVAERKPAVLTREKF